MYQITNKHDPSIVEYFNVRTFTRSWPQWISDWIRLIIKSGHKITFISDGL